MPPRELRAKLIVRNAKVTTLAEDIADAEAVAVSGETFAAVGGEAAVMRLADRETRVIDAGGRRLIPGLNDSHAVHGHAVQTGRTYDNHFVSVITIENRKVTRWRDYLDTVAVFNAIGWPAQ
jgi:predicted amidohydrolase YtcJ